MTTSPAPSDFFRGFGGASIRGGGNFLVPGVYDLEVLALLRKTSENPTTRGHKIVVCELTVTSVVTAYAADHGTAAVGAPPDWSASNQRGEKVSYIQNFTKHHAMAMGNAKGLLLAVLNSMSLAKGGKPIGEKDLTPEQWEQAIEMATSPPGEWAKGVKVRAHVSKTRTKAKTPFSPVTWAPLAPAAPAAPVAPVAPAAPVAP
mgnify:CR=1 FL=1